jgi:hypothetical protein
MLGENSGFVAVVLINEERVRLWWSLPLSSLMPTPHRHHHHIHHIALRTIVLTLNCHLLMAKLVLPISLFFVNLALMLSLLCLHLVLKHHVAHHITK